MNSGRLVIQTDLSLVAYAQVCWIFLFSPLLVTPPKEAFVRSVSWQVSCMLSRQQFRVVVWVWKPPLHLWFIVRSVYGEKLYQLT